MTKINQIKFIDLFSGIGGFRKSLELLGNDLNFNTKCIGFSEIDKYATQTYKSNYSIIDEKEIGDIVNFVDNEDISQLDDFDILFGGFPCQPFSMMGKQLGLEDERGSLFFSVVKLLKVKKPKYILLENVRNLYTHNKGDTYKKIKQVLTENGYNVYEDIFNTADYGLPQTRRRLYIFGIKSELDSGINFSSDLVKNHYNLNHSKTSINKYENVLDGLLDMNLKDEKYFLSEKIKPTILSNGSKNFKSNSQINQLIARPLTATMVKMHRACQDNYYSQEFLDSKCKFTYLENKLEKIEEEKHNIRKITPWEALKLQGFDDIFYENALVSGVSNHQLYKQAGNAVSVNTVYSVLKYLVDFNYIK